MDDWPVPEFPPPESKEEGTMKIPIRRALPIALALVVVLAGALAPARPARADTADLWGFAYSHDPAPAVWTTMDTGRQWGSWKAAHPGDWAEVIRTAQGRYRVRFPWLAAGQRGVVHVTPVGSAPTWCAVVTWFSAGADEIVEVQCAGPAGPADTRFTVMFTTSSGVLGAGVGSHAYVHYQGALFDSYNSTGAINGVAQSGPGEYVVRLLNVGVNGLYAGNAQVTAVRRDGVPIRCKIGERWTLAGTSVSIPVRCFSPGGAPADSGFVLSYHRERAVTGELAPPKRFGYIWHLPPMVHMTNFNGTGGFFVNSVTPVAVGRYTLEVPFAGVRETHLQLTGYGNHPGYCTIAGWSSTAAGELHARITCFDNAGGFADQSFLATATSRI
jgi:hypothetical protein